MARRDELSSHPRGPYFFGPSRTPEHTVPTEGVEQAGSLVNFDSVDVNRRIINLWDGALIPVSQFARRNADNSFTGTNTFRRLLAEGDNLYDLGTGTARFRKGWLYSLDLAAALNVAGLAVLSGGLSMKDTRITNLADPVAVQDAATKQYVLDIGASKTTYSDLWDNMIVSGCRVDPELDINGAFTGKLTLNSGSAYISGRRYVVQSVTHDVKAAGLASGVYTAYLKESTSKTADGALIAGVVWDLPRTSLAAKENVICVYEWDAVNATFKVMAEDTSADGVLQGKELNGYYDLRDPYTAKMYAYITLDANGQPTQKRSILYLANNDALWPIDTTLDLGGITPGKNRWATIFAKDGDFLTSLKVGGTNVALTNHAHFSTTNNPHNVTAQQLLATVRATADWQNSVWVDDTRDTNFAPQDRNRGFYFDFKRNTTDGLNDGGTYHGVLTFRYWGSTGDLTGGPVHQMGFTEYGGLHMRRSTSATAWSSWIPVYNYNTHPYVARVGAPSTYGSVGMVGSTNGYSGIWFNDASTYFMIRNADSLSGVYHSTGGWKWYFDGSGVLSAGTVPAARVASGTLGAGNFIFQDRVYVSSWLHLSTGGGATGLYWGGGTGANWYIYPSTLEDMRIRSGSTANSSLVFTINDTIARGYIHWTTTNEIGFLTSGRAWALQVFSDKTVKTHGPLINSYGHNLRPVIVSATAPSTTAEEGTIWIQI